MKLFIITSMVIFSFNMVKAADMLQPGQKAPDFELRDQFGKTHKLSDYLGKTVVLYFYPKDDTPGCTAEACNIRDNFSTLTERGIVVLGISYDDRESHQEFVAKYNLPFTILSDTAKTVAEAYGAKGGILGFIGAKRITYIIDKAGIIRHLIRKVDTKNHSRQILDLLSADK